MTSGNVIVAFDRKHGAERSRRAQRLPDALLEVDNPLEARDALDELSEDDEVRVRVLAAESVRRRSAAESGHKPFVGGGYLWLSIKSLACFPQVSYLVVDQRSDVAVLALATTRVARDHMRKACCQVRYLALKIP